MRVRCNEYVIRCEYLPESSVSCGGTFLNNNLASLAKTINEKGRLVDLTAQFAGRAQ